MNSSNKRAVAFLDILGFKKMIDTLPVAVIGEKYESLVKLFGFIDDYFSEGKFMCDRFIFSDSIILIAKNDTEESFIDLIIYTWKISQISLSHGLPLRGGIAYDEIYINKEMNIFVGKALTNAYELEHKQNWIGISVDDSAINRYENIFHYELGHIYESILYKYNVPFKDGNTKLMNTINWRNNLIVELGTKSLFPYQDNNDVNEKINNTLSYARSVVSSGNIYILGTEIPKVFTPVWVGKTEPPFKHGDEM